MLRTMKRLMALSLGMALPVDAQRTRLTWPRPFLLRPWLPALDRHLGFFGDDLCGGRVSVDGVPADDVCVASSRSRSISCCGRRLAAIEQRGLARARGGRAAAAGRGGSQAAGGRHGAAPGVPRALLSRRRLLAAQVPQGIAARRDFAVSLAAGNQMETSP